MTRRPGGLGAPERMWIAVGLIVAIAAIDIFALMSTALIGVLVAAPLIAATAGTPKRTALVAVAAALTALLLGIADDFFLTTDHLVRASGVVLGGALAVWIASLRRDRESDSMRLGVQYSVARVLSDTSSLEEAGEPLLRAIGVPLGWEIGSLWILGADRRLRCMETWCDNPVDSGEFAADTRSIEVAPGQGLPGLVAERRTTVWMPDVQTEPDFLRKEAATQAGVRGAVAFPVMAGDAVAGVLEFFARDVREPDKDLLELMRALTSQIAEYLEGIRAAEALRASEARKGAILDSALDCVISMDHEGRVLEFNPAAQRTFGYTTGDVLGRDMAELIIPPSLRDRHRAALARFVETEEPTILGRRIELTAMRKDGSEFPIELAINRIGSGRPPTFTGVVRDISQRVSADQEREELLRLEQLARLDAVQARDQVEAILRGVADAVTAQGPDGKLIFANDAAAQTLGFDSIEQLLAAPLSQIMEGYEMFDEEGKPFPLDRLPGRLAFAGENAEAVIRFFVRETGEERWSVVKASPLVGDDGRVIMAINVIEDVTEHKRSERHQLFLSESSGVLASSLDLDETLRQVAQLAVPDIADWCAVDVRSETGAIERVALAHTDPAQVERARELEQRYPTDPNSPTGVPAVLRTGESLLYPEITDEMIEASARSPEHLEEIRAIGMRSAMVVPMMVRDEPAGAMTFVSGRSGRRFDEHDLELVQELGRRCGTAVENARLYSERAYIAKTLQESLLPAELPAIPGLETAARFRASGDGNEVGGDFYDLFETGRKGWTVVVGDVCGKGPDAAAITALARYTLRAAAMRERLPSRSLRLLNEALLRQREDRRFCTVAYAYFEPLETGARVGFASGGHPLPIVLRADGETEWLGEHGTVLGVVPDPELEDRGAELAPGDALVFYTDGVTEAKGAGGMLGEERLAELVADVAGQDADSIAGHVEAAALDLQEGPPRDDIAVVVLRVPR